MAWMWSTIIRFGIFTNIDFLHMHSRVYPDVDKWDIIRHGEDEQEEEKEEEKMVETFLSVSMNYGHVSQTHLPSDNY